MVVLSVAQIRGVSSPDSILGFASGELTGLISLPVEALRTPGASGCCLIAHRANRSRESDIPPTTLCRTFLKMLWHAYVPSSHSQRWVVAYNSVTSP